MEKYIIELTKDELLALRDVMGQIEDHNSWMVEAIDNADLLPSIYQKIYELANPVIEEVFDITIKTTKRDKMIDTLATWLLHKDEEITRYYD